MAIAATILISIFLLVIFLLFSKEKHKASLALGELKRCENEIEFLRQNKKESENQAEEKINLLQQKLLNFEKQNEVLKQAEINFDKQKQDWQKDKDAMLLQLAEELMKKNQQQQDRLSNLQQENIKKITENLFKNFENVAAKLSALDDEVKKSSLEISQTRNALLTPGGAGLSAEITLENILKNSNLMEKESLNSVGDYILQSHFSSTVNSSAKRPDAIVFLPGNQILVIDSKSSAHFLELEKAQNDEEKKEILTKIKTTFRKHLEDLKRKDYSDLIFDELRSAKISDHQIFLVMFLQTEQMLEIVKKADPEFETRAAEADIIAATPIALIHLLSRAKFIIDRFKQEKNIEALKVEIQKLLDALSLIMKDSSEVGRLINKALSAYNKLAKDLNKTNILSRNISELGIEGKKKIENKMLEEFEVEED